jgi:hypothetical protein
MALFQFTALDAAGTEKRGTIEAVTPQEAVVAIQRYGLQPTQVFAINPLQSQYPGPALPGYAPAGSSGKGKLSLVLSALAIVISLGVLGWQLVQSKRDVHPAPDSLGKGLSAYNFSTPKDALISELKIKKDRDIKAQLELLHFLPDRDVNEKLRTLQVRKQEVWKDKTILFIEYEKNGVKKYLTQGYVKDLASGKWLPRFVGSWEVRNENATLANQMENFQKTGQLN